MFYNCSYFSTCDRLSSDLNVSNIPKSESNTVELDTTINTDVVVASAAVPSTVENGERYATIFTKGKIRCDF